ncbi:thioredoxin-like protein [Chitinophaga skermanii]|uniref:Thioredoxin-like protein n=1 Tax=Chitinophaga skermanii TaxID=331697 RepID=A0A327QVX0_9BACT|nr:thioredoxin family protein [Chitinophaga skermanii]RAJ08491.1 thioredoxin-like protein [Chitinophaga skermanii]
MTTFSKLILACAFVFAFSGLHAQETQFLQGKFSEALAKAKATNKPIFVDLYFEGCMPCKKMDQETFKDEKVSNYFNENYVCYKVDIFKEEDGKVLCRKFAVSGFPTYLFLTPSGQFVEGSSGFTGADRFLPLMQASKALADKNQTRQFSAKLDESYPAFYSDGYLNPKSGIDTKAAIATYAAETNKYTAEVNFVVQSRYFNSMPTNIKEAYFANIHTNAKNFNAKTVANCIYNYCKVKAEGFAAKNDQAGFDAMIKHVRPVFTEHDWAIFGKIMYDGYYTKLNNTAAYIDYVGASSFYDIIDKANIVFEMLPKLKDNAALATKMGAWFNDKEINAVPYKYSIANVFYAASIAEYYAKNQAKALSYGRNAAESAAANKAPNLKNIEDFYKALQNNQQDYVVTPAHAIKPMIMN